MRILITVTYWVYALVFLVSGLGGVFLAHEEMHVIFSLNLEPAATDGGATLLSQYRFLRGVEATFERQGCERGRGRLSSSCAAAERLQMG